MTAYRTPAGVLLITRTSRRGVYQPNVQTDGIPFTHGLWAADQAASAVANGALLSSFPNMKGGTWINPGGTTRPTFVLASSTFNGRSAIQFNGVNSTRLTPSAFSSMLQTYYVTAIAAFTAAVGVTETLVGTGTSSGAAGLGRRSAGDAYNASDAAVLASGISVNASPKLLVAKFSGGSSYTKVNGAQGFTGNAGSSNLSNLKIGAGGVGTAIANPFTGLVHLVLVTNYDPETSVYWPVIQAVARDCGVPV